MQHAQLGSSGLLVSRLAFGAMTFTAGNPAEPSINKVDQSLAARMVAKALDAGVNLFDTANNYDRGDSELILGELLKPHRSEVLIATKVGMRTGRGLLQTGLSRRHILLSIDESLRRLSTDWVDLYIAHRPDFRTPIDETIEALDEVVRSGKARYLGFSNWPAWLAASAIERQRDRGLAPFTHGQLYYSLVGRDIETEFVPMLRHFGLGLTCWSPLASGFLSGRYTRDTLRQSGGRFGSNRGVPFDINRGFATLEVLNQVAAERNLTPSKVALAWLLHQRPVSSIIIGASSPAQLDDNLVAADVVLAPADIERLSNCCPPLEPYPHSIPWTDKRTESALGVPV